jgi:K+-sensing histidine kinase KdpD
MTDTLIFSSSTSPREILIQLIQDLENLLTSSQENLNILRIDNNNQKQKSDVAIGFFQDGNRLIQLFSSIENYLDALEIDSPSTKDEVKNVSKNASMEVLRAFVHEIRHPVASMQGWMSIMQSTKDHNIELQAIESFDGLLQTIKDMHSKLSDIVSEI